MTAGRDRHPFKACQWPFPAGERAGKASETRFDCAAEALRGRPYCAAHCARAYLVKRRGKAPRRWRPEDETTSQATSQGTTTLGTTTTTSLSTAPAASASAGGAGAPFWGGEA